MEGFPCRYHHAASALVGPPCEGGFVDIEALLRLFSETLDSRSTERLKASSVHTPGSSPMYGNRVATLQDVPRPAKRQKTSAAVHKDPKVSNSSIGAALSPTSSAAHVLSLNIEVSLVTSATAIQDSLDTYQRLLILLQDNTPSATPVSFLAFSELQARSPTFNVSRQKRSKTETPPLEFAVVGEDRPILSCFLSASDEQWDVVAGTRGGSGRQGSGLPAYWLDDLLTLTKAAKLLPDQTASRPARYHVKSDAKLCWMSADDLSDVKLLVTVDAYIDPSISLQSHLGFDPRQPHIDADHQILNAFFPPEPSIQRKVLEAPRQTSLRGFYDALSPAPGLAPALHTPMQPPAMRATLLPFQLRSVAWLCYREGMPMEGYAGRPDAQISTNIWERLHLACGQYRYCRLLGEIRPATDTSADVPLSAVDWRGVRGTLLSEEMGLGKTLEAIAVMMLHRHPLCPPLLEQVKTEDTEGSLESPFVGMRAWDETAQLYVETVGATLVVTPANLLPQWIAEFEKHAPAMRLCVYKGWRSLVQRDTTAPATERPKNKVEEEAADTRVIGVGGDMSTETEKQRLFIDFVRRHDVVLTTYDALVEDSTVAKAIPPRSRRSNVEYREHERPRSPLVMAKWWRVCMDEVQMQNDRISADMVSLIPREYSLAISGTPAKRGTADLVQTLRFLRVPVVPEAPRLWDRLQKPLFQAVFTELFSQIAVRTTKADVKRELTIPAQTRWVVPVQLSDIEMHYYLETLDACRQVLQIDDVGQPTGVDWALNPAELRQSLLRLRQICTHIQVGQLGRNQSQLDGGRFRINLGRELMTMEDALEKMLFDHQQNQLGVLRSKLAQSVKKAQLITMDETDELRLLKAGTIYANACTEAERAIALCYEAIATLRKDESPQAEGEDRKQSVASGSGSDDDADDDDDDPVAKENERLRRAKIFASKSMIRELMLILHQATFFSGDVAHMKGDETAENNFYAAADAQRSEILANALQVARRAVRTLGSAITDFAMLEIEPRDNESGIYSKTVMENANHLVDLLNDNAELLWNWRAKIVALLATPLEAPPVAAGKFEPDEIPEKDHYQIALEAQGEIEAYLAAYASALADRREMLMEERSLLQQHEAQLQGQVITRVDLEHVDGETAQLLRELTAEREVIMKARRSKKPLKAALLALNDVRNKAESSAEIQLANDHAKWLRQALLKQGSHVEKLLKEVDGLRSSFNNRVSYFAALQVVSDSVQIPEIEKSLHADIAKLSQSIDESEVQLGRLVARTKYLKSLGKQQSQPDFRREDCVICFGASDDRHGCLLGCGHAFCQFCLRRACRSQQEQKCPMCKTLIERRAVSRFKYPEDTVTASSSTPLPAERGTFGGVAEEPDSEAVVAEEIVKEGETAALRRSLAQLRTMGSDRQAAINESDMIGDFGTKINFLVKHLHYLATHEPDARHIVFSNWRDSLKIVATALTQNGIRYVSLDQDTRSKNVAEQFRKDTSISVFLLHAEKESAGLTLTAARMVHLLEPVLAHGFELQAIGRVDRLGQQHETTVFCYSTMDTVEARILARAVRKGDSIYLKDGTAEQAQIAPAAKKGGDASTGDELELLELLC